MFRRAATVLMGEPPERACRRKFARGGAKGGGRPAACGTKGGAPPFLKNIRGGAFG